MELTTSNALSLTLAVGEERRMEDSWRNRWHGRMDRAASRVFSECPTRFFFSLAGMVTVLTVYCSIVFIVASIKRFNMSTASSSSPSP